MSDSKLKKPRAAMSWKQWYWYFALAANFLPCFGAALAIVLKDKMTSPWNMVYASLTAISILSFMAAYLHYSTKEARLFHTLIKPERTKYLQIGAIFSFASITCYIVGGIIDAFKNGELWNWGTVLGLNMFLGFISTASLTLYEFCVSFDVYYHKNKHEIIHDFLKHHKKPLNLSKETLDELSERSPEAEEEVIESDEEASIEVESSEDVKK